MFAQIQAKNETNRVEKDVMDIVKSSTSIKKINQKLKDMEIDAHAEYNKRKKEVYVELSDGKVLTIKKELTDEGKEEKAKKEEPQEQKPVQKEKEMPKEEKANPFFEDAVRMQSLVDLASRIKENEERRKEEETKEVSKKEDDKKEERRKEGSSEEGKGGGAD